jgi:hypothetical protein
VADPQGRLTAPAADRSRLVGTWRLVRWASTTRDGAVIYPFGEDASGLLLYAEDGSMLVALMHASRERLVSGDLLGATVDEKARAASEFLSYGGRWELRGDTVVHHVDLALNPNWVGVLQKRRVELDGDRLTLGTGWMTIDGVEQTSQLTWQRVR